MFRALLAVAVLLVSAAPAQGAQTTVAGFRGFTLQAEERGSRICLTLRRERRYQGEQCGRIPRSPHRPVSIMPYVNPSNYAAAVAGSVRTAQVEYDDGRRRWVPTFGRRGFAARFVILPAAPPAAKFIRFFAADGTLLGMDGGPAGYVSEANVLQLLGDRDVGVRAYTEPRLDPAPDEPDRLATRMCVDVVNEAGGSGWCDFEGENVLVVKGSCEGPALVGAVLAPGVAAVRLTLTSGMHLQLPANALPAAFGGRRAVAAPLPAGEGVRAAAAVDAAGRDVAHVAVGMTPGGQPCAGEDRGDDAFIGVLRPVLAPPAVVVVGELVAGDQGERLCVGIRALAAHTCPRAPVDSDRPRLHALGKSVGGVLSRDADRITLEFDRGADLTVRTTAGGAYTGRWAGQVRFFAARVPDGAQITGAVVRDAAGRIIGISDRGLPRSAQTRRVLVERGGLGLELVRRSGRDPCVTPPAAELPPSARYCTDRDPGTPIDGPVRRYGATVTVACAPRAALAYGRVPDGQRLPEVVLDGGRTVRATRIRLADDDAWVAFIPDARVLGVRAAGEEAVALNLPPASAQCGYSTSRSF